MRSRRERATFVPGLFMGCSKKPPKFTKNHFLIQALGFAYAWHYRLKVDNRNRLNNIAFWIYVSHLAVIAAWLIIIIILISTGNFQS